jgi:hypothetical protein
MELGDWALAACGALLASHRDSLSSPAVVHAVSQVETRFDGWPALLSHPLARRAFVLHALYAIETGDPATAQQLCAAVLADGTGAYAGVARTVARAADAAAAAAAVTATEAEADVDGVGAYEGDTAYV